MGMERDGDTFFDEGLYEELNSTFEEEYEGGVGVQDNASSTDFATKRGEIHHALMPVVRPIKRSVTDVSSAGSTSDMNKEICTVINERVCANIGPAIAGERGGGRGGGGGGGSVAAPRPRPRPRPRPARPLPPAP